MTTPRRVTYLMLLDWQTGKKLGHIDNYASMESICRHVLQEPFDPYNVAQMRRCMLNRQVEASLMEDATPGSSVVLVIGFQDGRERRERLIAVEVMRCYTEHAGLDSLYRNRRRRPLPLEPSGLRTMQNAAALGDGSGRDAYGAPPLHEPGL